MSCKRPRPVAEEDEDDLIRLQNDFLQSKITSSAQLVSQQRKPAPAGGKKRQETGDESTAAASCMTAGVVERDVTGVTFVPRPRIGKPAFPDVFHRDVVMSPAPAASGDRVRPGPRPQSIFARQFGMNSHSAEFAATSHTGCMIDGSGLGPAGRHEVQKIQEENMDLIHSLSDEQRQQLRSDMLSSLKPDIVNFLKHKSKQQPVRKSPITDKLNKLAEACASTQSESMDTDPASGELPQVTAEIVKDFADCPHMDAIENEKLKWMSSLTTTKSTAVIENEARFGFDGLLILPDDPSSSSMDMDTGDSTLRQGLHHHGVDQHKAGYNLNELFTFIDSSNAGQKVIGLQVIGNIMQRCNRGEYEDVFDSGLSEQLLEGSALLLMVRRCLDDTNQTVTTAAINCLRHLICNTDMDELHLDRLFCWNMGSFPIPFLDPNALSHVENVKELTDEQMIRMDPIRGLIRTDVLLRLRYLMDNLIRDQDDPVIVKNVIAILIRMSRHSLESCTAIVETPYLLENIISHFLKPAISFNAKSFYGNPFAQALKLIRILSGASGQVASKILAKFPELLHSCRVYLTIDPSVTNNTASADGRSSKSTPSDFLRLSLESLRMHCVCLQHSSSSSSSVAAASFDSLQQVFPILIRQSQYLLTMSPLGVYHEAEDGDSSSGKRVQSNSQLFDWHFASALIACMDRIAAAAGESLMQECKDKLTFAFKPIIEAAVLKWITLLVNQSLLPEAVDVNLTIWIAIRFLLHSDRIADKAMLITDSGASSSSKSRDKLFQYFVKSLAADHKTRASSSLWTKVIRNLTAGSLIAVGGGDSIQLKETSSSRNEAGDQFNFQNSKGTSKRSSSRSYGAHPDFGSSCCCRRRVRVTTAAADLRSGSTQRSDSCILTDESDCCLPLFHAITQILLQFFSDKKRHNHSGQGRGGGGEEQEKEKGIQSCSNESERRSSRYSDCNFPDQLNNHDDDGCASLEDCLKTLILTQGLVRFVSSLNRSLSLTQIRGNAWSIFHAYHFMVFSELALLSGKILLLQQQNSGLTAAATNDEAFIVSKAAAAPPAIHEVAGDGTKSGKTGSSGNHSNYGEVGQRAEQSIQIIRNDQVKAALPDFLQLSLSLLTLIPDPIVKQDIKTGIVFHAALYHPLIACETASTTSTNALVDKMDKHLRIREQEENRSTGSFITGQAGRQQQRKPLSGESFVSAGVEQGEQFRNDWTGSFPAAGNLDHGISLRYLNEKLQHVSFAYHKYSSCGSCYWIFDPILKLTTMRTKVRMTSGDSSRSTDLNPCKKVPEIPSTTASTTTMDSDSGHSDEANPIESCLFFVRLLSDALPDFLFPDPHVVRDHFMLISCAFLTLDGGVLSSDDCRSHLDHFLNYYLSLGSGFRIKSQDSIPSDILSPGREPGNEKKKRESALDLFDLLVREYESSSYSDPLFTSFILLFLRSTAKHSSEAKQNDVALKLRFFSEENSSCLQSMTTMLETFDRRLLQQLIEEQESDLRIIEAYVRCLLSGVISKDRNQVLYMMAAFHTSRSLYLRPLHPRNANEDRDGDPERVMITSRSSIDVSDERHDRSDEEEELFMKLKRSIDLCSNSSLKRDLLNYQVIL